MFVCRFVVIERGESETCSRGAVKCQLALRNAIEVNELNAVELVADGECEVRGSVCDIEGLRKISAMYCDLQELSIYFQSLQVLFRHHVDGTQAQRGIIDRVFFKPNDTRHRFTDSVNETFRVAGESLVR